MKAVGNGQGEGLLSDLQTQDLARPSGSCRQTRRLALHPGTQAEQPLIGGWLAKLNAQSQDVGVELFPGGEEMPMNAAPASPPMSRTVWK